MSNARSGIFPRVEPTTAVCRHASPPLEVVREEPPAPAPRPRRRVVLPPLEPGTALRAEADRDAPPRGARDDGG